jgi:hypothetical protein
MLYLLVGLCMTCCFACAAPARANEVPQAVAQDAGDGLPPEALSAGALLHRAFELFRQEKDSPAVTTFYAAIGTGSLNDAGRALAYWHIFVAQQHLGHEDGAADALGSFVVVAQDVLDEADQARNKEEGADEFVVRFDLRRRLSRARATLSAVWASHSNLFGRRVNQPVLVHNDVEKDYFLQLAMPCAHSQVRQTVGQNGVVGPLVEEVNVRCGEAQSVQQSYYFQTVQDPTAN